MSLICHVTSKLMKLWYPGITSLDMLANLLFSHGQMAVHIANNRIMWKNCIYRYRGRISQFSQIAWLGLSLLNAEWHGLRHPTHAQCGWDQANKVAMATAQLLHLAGNPASDGLEYYHVGIESSCRSVSWHKESFLSSAAACRCRQ